MSPLRDNPPCGRGRLKPGSHYGQDHGFHTWPKEKAHIIFDVHYFTKDTIQLKASGYGEHGDYGNGALFVKYNDINWIGDPAEMPFTGENI